MKTLIYIGNKSAASKGANVSSIDVLCPLFTKCGYKVYSASSIKNIILRLLHMLWTCFKYRKQVDYVLIDTYSTRNFYYAYLVSLLCVILKLKYIPLLRGGNLPRRLKMFPKLSKAIFKNAFVNVAPSLYMKSNFENYGFHNIVCIPNSIVLDNYEFKDRVFESINLLWVRSFSKIYNPLLAIDILKAFKNDNIQAKLCMVGPDSDGSLQEAKKYANQLGVKVLFTGKLSKPEWVALSKDYNIFINTTNFDNMPVSVIEAMALGLPIISTNVGGMPFLIEHNKNGFLVVPKLVTPFVLAIKNITSDSDNTKSMVKTARRQVEHFNWDFIQKQWAKVLR